MADGSTIISATSPSDGRSVPMSPTPAVFSIREKSSVAFGYLASLVGVAGSIFCSFSRVTRQSNGLSSALDSPHQLLQLQKSFFTSMPSNIAYLSLSEIRHDPCRHGKYP
jgi:hypothetical protein